MPRPLVRTLVAVAAAFLASSSVLVAQQSASKPLSRANLDTTCAPCTDFYEFANGGWLKTHTIPPDKSNLGSFGMLGDKNQEVVQKIVIDDALLVRDGEAKAGSNDWKIGTFYAACMDTSLMEKSGVAPIKPALNAIAEAKTTDDVVKLFGSRALRGGGGGGGGGGRGGGGGVAPFSLGPQTDPKNSKMVILSANQGGLGLNREDYLGTGARAEKRRADYVDHITRSFVLIGEPESQAAADAKTVMDLETAIAKITIPQADMRDPVATYHKMTLAEFGKSTPHIDWTRYLQQQGAKTTSDVNVRAPTYFAALDTLVTATPVDTWKTYLRWHVVNGAMNSLSAPFRKEAFRWQQVTTGVKRAAVARQAVRRLDQRRARRSGRRDLDQAQLLARGQSTRGEDGRQPRLGAARSDQRARLDEPTHQGAGRRQAQRVPSQGRLPRQVARLLDARDQARFIL